LCGSQCGEQDEREGEGADGEMQTVNRP
jgi:hypothetical protein